MRHLRPSVADQSMCSTTKLILIRLMTEEDSCRHLLSVPELELLVLSVCTQTNIQQQER